VFGFYTYEMKETEISLVTSLSPLEIKSREPNKNHWKLETLHFWRHSSNTTKTNTIKSNRRNKARKAQIWKG